MNKREQWGWNLTFATRGPGMSEEILSTIHRFAALSISTPFQVFQDSRGGTVPLRNVSIIASQSQRSMLHQTNVLGLFCSGWEVSTRSQSTLFTMGSTWSNREPARKKLCGTHSNRYIWTQSEFIPDQPQFASRSCLRTLILGDPKSCLLYCWILP